MASLLRIFRFLPLLTLITSLSFSPAHASPLHRNGNRLVDADGKEVRLTGINWFGFETSNFCPHGLWTRDWKAMLLDVQRMGFNCIRIPYCDKMLEPDAKAGTINTFGTEPALGIVNGPINSELVGKTPLEILDVIIDGCGKLGLKVILDDHSRGPDGYIAEKVWYTAEVPEAKWIADWSAMAARYKGNGTVVACDLDNEPHGSASEGGSQWGTGIEAYDWRLAAEKCGNAILKANPDVLIMVEGVEQAGATSPTSFASFTSYWWGGNLIAAKAAPIRLDAPEKLIYSAHEYGPEVFAQTWFSDAAFPANLPAIWDKNFGYLSNEGTSPVFIGEFGIRDTASDGGKAGIWLDAFLRYMGTAYSWTFWCLNPNSGDTGGILGQDWRTPEQWKLDRLKPYLAPLVSGPGPGFSGIRNSKVTYAASGSLRTRGAEIALPFGLRHDHRLELLSLAGKRIAAWTLHPSAQPSVTWPGMRSGPYLARLSGPDHAGTWILSE